MTILTLLVILLTTTDLQIWIELQNQLIEKPAQERTSR